MKYAIVENEPFALINLTNIMSQLRKNYELVFTAESVKNTIDFFRSRPNVDLVFMDIELVDGNCFDIFNQIEIDIPVIFTTAYNEYAINAFSVNSIDYILKPVSESAVLSAINKLEKYSFPSKNFDYSNIQKLMGAKSFRKRILTNRGDAYHYVEVSKIAYFLSEDKYIFIYTDTGKRHITGYTNLNQVEDDINPEEYYRVSRNIIVYIKNIVGVKKYYNGRLKLKISCGEETFEVLVSAAKRISFLDWYGGGNGD